VAIATLLANAGDAEFADLALVTSMFLAAMSGTVRIAFERGATPAMWRSLSTHPSTMCRVYLQEIAIEKPALPRCRS